MDERDPYPIEPTSSEYGKADADDNGASGSAEPPEGESPVERQPTVPPPIASGPIASGIRCITCGHDLSGTAIGAVCPECGAPVTRSLGSTRQPTRAGQHDRTDTQHH